MGTSTVLIIIILCIGAIQGLVLGGILFRSTKINRWANRILAIILWLFAYRLIVQVMRLFGLGYYDGWYYIMLDYSWVTGAFLYFYSRAQTTPSFRFRQKDWIHFVPLVLQIGISIFVRIQNLYWDGTRESLSWAGYWGYVIWMNNPTIYIVASVLIVYYSWISERLLIRPNSDLRLLPESQNWMKIILRAFRYYFMGVLVILLADLIIYNAATDLSYFYFQRFYYYPFFIGMAVLTYWIGMAGYARRNQEGAQIKKSMTDDERSRLEQIASALQRVMEEKHLYKSQDISIQSLADELGVKPYLVSRSLNEILDQKFNDYINAFRVEEVRRLVNDPSNDQFTLLSLAMEAGFNSKSSFQRAVKKHLGIAPSELKSS